MSVGQRRYTNKLSPCSTPCTTPCLLTLTKLCLVSCGALDRAPELGFGPSPSSFWPSPFAVGSPRRTPPRRGPAFSWRAVLRRSDGIFVRLVGKGMGEAGLPYTQCLVSDVACGPLIIRHPPRTGHESKWPLARMLGNLRCILQPRGPAHFAPPAP